MGDQAPHVDKITNTTANVAAGATDSFAIGEVKYAGEVTAISYLPDAAATPTPVLTRSSIKERRERVLPYLEPSHSSQASTLWPLTRSLLP
jgi:hypothetical protein